MLSVPPERLIVPVPPWPAHIPPLVNVPPVMFSVPAPAGPYSEPPPTPKPFHQAELPVYESPEPKVTVLPPVTTADTPLTGGVFQVAALLQAPLLVE